MLPLETLTRIEKLVTEAAAPVVLETHKPALLIDGKVVDIEHLSEGRSRFRGQFSTSVLAEFAAYLRDHSGEATSDLFISPDKAIAIAYLNLGDANDPGHGDWKAQLSLKETAAYAAALMACGSRFTQREMAEWAEDWAGNLTALNGENQVPLSAAIAAIRNITIAAKKDVTNTDEDFGASRSALEQIEARGAGGMPTHFLLTTAPYTGFHSRDIKLRLSVITGDSPALKLRIVGKEQEQENILTEFKERLQEATREHVTTAVIGSFSP